ncbi:hypothetical protein [Anaplasma bovis]
MDYRVWAVRVWIEKAKVDTYCSELSAVISWFAEYYPRWIPQILSL